jgi:hypothetical protein
MLNLNFDLPYTLKACIGFLNVANFPYFKNFNLLKFTLKVWFKIKVENQDAPIGFSKRGKTTFLLYNNGILITLFLVIGQLPYFLAQLLLKLRGG